MGRKNNSKRGGDVLGLGGADATITNSETMSPEIDSGTDEARRRRRMSEGADEVTPGGGSALQQTSGATGIDMGAGGQGTDVE
ncbi:MAG TPA: hypothetical protein VKH34_02395 [Vicinamibacterales bacterium]|nr:hypothetical protein [Vicinamibacterales bacterium]